ncbi:hypothetical protein H4R20_002940 [Coemansia guatemalensis]|uniref:Bromo domain-containing protein n=1 Tax=Coemansia guatemalensis TaxID=2761395 RepID=A0A9W8HU85_9FUNG|nr:hypothetical protein H4R20_002940 [Coemansia guatemalensis]
MAGVDTDNERWPSPEDRQKRARYSDSLEADEHDDTHSKFKPANADHNLTVPVTPTARQPTKIKLSFKLGALRRHEPATVVATDRLATGQSTPGDEIGPGDEHVDIDGGMDYEEHSGGPPTALAGSHVSGNHTPRIKLRLSLNGASSASAAPTTPVTSTRQDYNSWEGSIYDSMAASPMETALGSPSESMASNGSSAYQNRMAGGAQIVYSPSQVSDAESDENQDANYIISDAENHTYEHMSHTPGGSGGSAGSTPRGTGFRRRGRPPMRGRHSMGGTRWQSGPPMSARKPSGSFTTTVSLRSSLQRLVTRIRKRDSYGFFLEPVDTNVITDYLNVIKEPMDLGTMRRKVETEAYRSIDEFRQDLLLVCSNARQYNGAGSIYGKSADRMQEYALLAISRETVKLERVGKASLPARTADNESDSFYAPRSRSQTGSVSPSRYGMLDDYGEHHATGGIYAIDPIIEHRRSSRLRWRGTSEPQSQPQQHASLTPASILDNFKWSGTSKKKARKTSSVPRRILDSQTKVSLLADGSIDPAGFEEDVAMIPFASDYTAPPLLAGMQPTSVSRSSGDSSAQCTYAHGRYYSPASLMDYGPYRAGSRATTGSGPSSEPIGHGLSSIHGDSLGLAYWHSISEFVEGASEDVTQYAARVMDHLSGGAHAVARDALGFLGSRQTNDSESHVSHAGKSGLYSKPGLGSVDITELTAWLDGRSARDQLALQRFEALTRQISLRDVSMRCAEERDAAIQTEHLTDSRKRELYASNNDALAAMHDQWKAGTALPQQDLLSLESDIYTLAEQMCLSVLGSKQPSTQLPRLARPVQPPSLPSARTVQTTGLRQHPMPGAQRIASPRRGPAIAPRPNRATSTPSLPTLQSASLASEVRTAMLGMSHDSDTDRGFSL